MAVYNLGVLVVSVLIIRTLLLDFGVCIGTRTLIFENCHCGLVSTIISSWGHDMGMCMLVASKQNPMVCMR